MAEKIIPKPPPPSWWDRRPWLGAGLFALVVVGTGVALALTVTIRPHYRGPEWRLFTEVPPAGTGSDRGPARCLIPKAFARDPVRIMVLAAARDKEGQPLGHQELLLAADGGRTLLSFGVTEPRGGTLHLAVPARFDEALFAGHLQVMAILPGLPPVTAPVGKPREGLVRVALELPRGKSLPVRIRRPDGSLYAQEVQVQVWAQQNQKPFPLSRGFRLLGGRGRIGGLPSDLELHFQVQAARHQPSQQLLRFSSSLQRLPETSLFLGPSSAVPAQRAPANPYKPGPGPRPTLQVSVQYQDGLPALGVLVALFGPPDASGKRRLLATSTTPPTGETMLDPQGQKSALLVAKSDLGQGFATASSLGPTVVTLHPWDTCAVTLTSSNKGQGPAWEKFMVQARLLSNPLPASAAAWLRPPPEPVSRRGRCRFPRLPPGTYALRLRPRTALKSASSWEVKLGQIKTGADGQALERTFQLPRLPPAPPRK